jgi:hypothetical protein
LKVEREEGEKENAEGAISADKNKEIHHRVRRGHGVKKRWD